MLAAVYQALAQAGGTGEHLVHTALCLAGVDWDDDRVSWESTLRDLNWPGHWVVHNDGFGLLRAGTPDGVGVAVSVGTGGAVTGRGPTGEWSASFWLGRQVGGDALGRAAIDAAARDWLGLGPSTVLTEALPNATGHRDLAELLRALTGRAEERPVQHADLARAVLEAAASADPAAMDIVERQARALCDYVVVAARQIGSPDHNLCVVLGGSVLTRTQPALRMAVEQRLSDLAHTFSVCLAGLPTVVGAVMEAFASSPGGLTYEVIHQLSQHTFPTGFFIT